MSRIIAAIRSKFCSKDDKLKAAVKRVLADPATQILSGHRVALEQLTQ